MKKVIVAIAALVMIHTAAISQRKNYSVNHKNIIKAAASSFLDLDEFPLGIFWETKTAKRQSLSIGIHPRYQEFNGDKDAGLAATLAYRFYISKNREGISGIYLSPTVKYGEFKQTYTFYTGNPGGPLTTVNERVKTTNLNIGVNFGHQFVWKSGFSLDLGVGIGYANSKGNPRYYYYGPGIPTSTYSEGGISGMVFLGVGYAF